MRGDRAAGRPSLPPPPLLLLWLLLLPWAAALHPGELFPYGESRGDQLLQEGDDESSAAVKLAVPLRFYDAQFSHLYVSSALPARCATLCISRSFFPGVSVVSVCPLPREGRK
jgi:nidogen (entactin)